MMSVDLRDLQKLSRPLNHIRFVQGITTLNKCHKTIIKTVFENERTVIRACHGIGKTFTLSTIVPWFLTTHPNSKVLTTAPTNRQVNHLLWNEIRKRHTNAIVPLGGKVLETPHWKLGDGWEALGYSPEKGRRNEREGETSQSAFQGFHAEDMLIIIDEAPGVPPAIWNQIEGMSTSGNVRIVAIGNPTTKNCRFYELFGSRAWAQIHLSIFDSPNLQVNKLYDLDCIKRELDHLLRMSPDEMRHRFSQYSVRNKALVTAKWVMTRALPEEWGIDSIPFRTRCLGEFPEVESDVFFPDDVVEAAIGREIEKKTPVLSRWYGVDPARYGSDETIITIIEDDVVLGVISMSGKDGMTVANRIVAEYRNRERVADEKILIDSTGLGGPILDRVKEMQTEGFLDKSTLVFEFNNGESADEECDPKERQTKDKERYANKKAKALDLLSQDINLISLPREYGTVYKRELTTLIYDYDSKGRKRAESKDDYKARTGKGSPDRSESLAYANYGRHIKAGRSVATPEIFAL